MSLDGIELYSKRNKGVCVCGSRDLVHMSMSSFSLRVDTVCKGARFTSTGRLCSLFCAVEREKR